MTSEWLLDAKYLDVKELVSVHITGLYYILIYNILESPS